MFHLLSGGVKQSPQKNYCCSLYGFLFQKSIRAQEEGGPWMVLSHQEEDALCSSQCKEQKAELNCWSRRCISLVSTSNFAASIPATSAKSPQSSWLATSLSWSLIVSANTLYSLAAWNSFMSFSVPHLQLIHLPVLPIPAIWLTSQEEWRDGKKLERCYSKENIKISLEISTLECSWNQAAGQLKAWQ